jgi:hypothetical protein
MSDFIMLTNVRVSFPHLFEKPMINGEEGKCGAALMLEPEKHTDSIKVLKVKITELIKDKLKGVKVPSDKLCLRNGEDKARPEYDGYVVLSANSKTKPIVIDNSGSGVIADPEQSSIYAGCYVNAKVRLWAQDNKYGKRINSELVAIQFASDGEPLDDAYVSVDSAMDGFGTSAANDSPDDDFLGLGDAA